MPQDFLALVAFGELFAQRPIDRFSFQRAIVHAQSKTFVRQAQLRHRAFALADHRADGKTRHDQRAGIGEQEQERCIGRFGAERIATLHGVPDGNCAHHRNGGRDFAL